MAGDAETGVSIMRLTAGLDSGPVCLRGSEPIGPDDDYGTLAARLQERSGELLVRALDERPPWVEQDAGRHHLRAQDRGRRPRARRDPHAGRARAPGARAAPAHRRAAAAARTAASSACSRPGPPAPTLAPAGGHLRTDGDRLLLDCRGGALELTEIQPPGGRPMPAEAWLRGRPDPALTDFWLDPRLPERPLEELVRLAVGEWDSPRGVGAATCPRSAGAGRPRCSRRSRRWPATRTRGPAASPPTWPASSARPCARCRRSRPRCWRPMGEREGHAGVLAVIAEAFGHLGEPWGLLVAAAAAPPSRRRRARRRRLRAGRPLEPARHRRADRAVGRSATPRSATGRRSRSARSPPQDSPALRDALAARLDDADPEARIEAVHGLALRGDTRAVEPALALLEAGRARRLAVDAPRAAGGGDRCSRRSAATRASRRSCRRSTTAGAGRRSSASSSGDRALRGLSGPRRARRRQPGRRRARGPERVGGGGRGGSRQRARGRRAGGRRSRRGRGRLGLGAGRRPAPASCCGGQSFGASSAGWPAGWSAGWSSAGVGRPARPRAVVGGLVGGRRRRAGPRAGRRRAGRPAGPAGRPAGRPDRAARRGRRCPSRPRRGCRCRSTAAGRRGSRIAAREDARDRRRRRRRRSCARAGRWRRSRRRRAGRGVGRRAVVTGVDGIGRGGCGRREALEFGSLPAAASVALE